MPQTATDTADAADAADTTDAEEPRKLNHLQGGATSAVLKEQTKARDAAQSEGGAVVGVEDGGKGFKKGSVVDVTILNGKQGAEDEKLAAGNTIDATDTPKADESAQVGDEGKEDKKAGDENGFDGDDFEYGEFDDYDSGDFWGWYDDLYQFVGDDWDDFFDIDDFESEWEYGEEDDCGGDDIDDDFFE